MKSAESSVTGLKTTESSVNYILNKDGTTYWYIEFTGGNNFPNYSKYYLEEF